MSVVTDIIYQLADDIVLRKEKFGGLIIRRANIDVFALNSVGYHILNLCKRSSVEEITDGLSTVFKNTSISAEQVKDDVRSFLSSAVSNKLVREVV